MAAKKTGRGGARVGAGRKPKAVEDRQRNRATVSLTDEEYEELEAAAGDESIGTFLRRVVLRYLARQRKR